MDLKQLTSDLRTARQLAAIVASERDDLRGSSNFDHVRLYVGNGRQLKRRTAKLIEAVEAAGCELGDDRSRGSFSLDLNVRTGQGLCRTAAAEAANKFLSACGWETTIYYILD